MKISVIIPVYSVDKYLTQCIDSVLNQSYSDIEIILVDDGSPDTSPAICDRYEKEYTNIKVIHKENGGLSDARNRGLEDATGEYVLFLDGDDFWDDTDALKMLTGRVSQTNADVLNFSFKKYDEHTKEKTPYFKNISAMPLEYKNKKDQLIYISDNHRYISSACTKLIRRELFSDNLLFEKGVYSEDVEWSARLIKAAKSMDFICRDFYCYRQRNGSISHTINDKKCADLCKHIINCIMLMETAEDSEKDALSGYAAFQFGTYFIVQAQAENWQKECIDKLNRYKHILEYHHNNKKLTILYWGTKILGYKNMCRIIRFAYKIKK